MKKDSDHVSSSHHSSPSRRNMSLSSQHGAVSSNAATSRGRIYSTLTTEGSIAWVTRDIAALDFLLGIPLQAEPTIVQTGFENQVQMARDAHVSTATGMWFEKYVSTTTTNTTNAIHQSTDTKEKVEEEVTELEKPNANMTHVRALAPGRRLDGEDAFAIHIPKTGILETKTRQRSIARQAAIREWERRVAHGINKVDNSTDGNAAPPLLDNRVFFSARGAYPMEIFSLVRYEPRREELLRKRQKLEELGGGGSEFVIPERDWRGTSYRALLPRVEKKNKSFQLLLLGKPLLPLSDVEEDDISTSSDESDAYVPGFLDDPEMVQGRHRHVMIGDRDTGSIVSSTIQFVKPEELKADLNKQFRERFDGWEPPKDQWKFIGAKIVDGVFTLQDPMDAAHAAVDDPSKEERRPRQGSMSSHTATTSSSVDAMHTIRMPPSLTLSKIRGVKQQALIAAVNANMEVSTVALACVYFERLCLDTRVDKSNRRLSFAACLLLASKINERNVRLDIQALEEEEDEGKFTLGLHSQVRPTKDSNSMFASLLEFFAHDWSLSLKTVFAAEWGVFVALGFSLHTTPSQVAFHFKRMMKTLGWSSLSYLGPEMYSQWQQSLDEEAERREAHEERKELRRDRNERKLLQLQRERLQQESQEQHRRDADSVEDGTASRDVSIVLPDDASTPSRASRKLSAMKLFHKFALKRNTSMEKLVDHAAKSEHVGASNSPKFREAHKMALMSRSPSLPVFSEAAAQDAHHVAIDIGEGSDDDISVGAVSDGGLMF